MEAEQIEVQRRMRLWRPEVREVYGRFRECFEESGLLDDLTKILDYGETKSRKRSGDKKLKKYRSLGVYQKLQIYNEVSCMRKKELSYRQIQKSIEEKYGVQLYISVISKWVRQKQHSLQNYNSLTTGPELAYAISAWLGDGRLHI